MKMRNLFLSLAMCSVLGFPAQSQGANAAAHSEANTPIYFLVDASGSMQGENQTNAELLLSALSFPQGQLISVNYFGGKPDVPGTDLCAETLVVAPPTPRGENFFPRLPELGGKQDKTAITNAILSVLAQVSGPAKLIVITDGGEECDQNFAKVRNSYPNANIEVRQVGNRPNSELQKLEIVPRQNATSPLVAPVFNLSFEVDAADSNSVHWPTGWYERRLWLLALAGLLATAWLWGSSFGKGANLYETETKLLEKKRREILASGSVSEEQMSAALPEELGEKRVRDTQTPDAWRSGFAFAVAASLGVPLIFFDFDYPTVASWAASLTLATGLLILLVFVVLNASPVSGPRKPSKFFRYAGSLPITVISGLAAICFVAWSFWIDLGEAQHAAWFVLSANFSGALAIAASAPLLFVGSKWWQFEMAKSNYQHTYTEAISNAIREKRRNDRRILEDWTRLKTRHSSWRPELEFTLFERFAPLRARNANKAREDVLERLRTIAINAGGNTASPEANKVLEEFLELRSVAKRIQAFLKSPNTQEHMVPVDDWKALADALDKKDSRRIADGYIKLAKSLV